MRELAADAADEAISSELRDVEAKLSSALEAEKKRKEKMKFHNMIKWTKGIYLCFIRSVTLILL